jgi:hypothetical protein
MLPVHVWPEPSATLFEHIRSRSTGLLPPPSGPVTRYVLTTRSSAGSHESCQPAMQGKRLKIHSTTLYVCTSVLRRGRGGGVRELTDQGCDQGIGLHGATAQTGGSSARRPGFPTSQECHEQQQRISKLLSCAFSPLPSRAPLPVPTAKPAPPASVLLIDSYPCPMPRRACLRCRLSDLLRILLL